MIDAKRLAELRKHWIESCNPDCGLEVDEPDCPIDFDEMADSLEALWRVVEAAEFLLPSAYLVAMADWTNAVFNLSRKPAFQDGVIRLSESLKALRGLTK